MCEPGLSASQRICWPQTGQANLKSSMVGAELIVACCTHFDTSRLSSQQDFRLSLFESDFSPGATHISARGRSMDARFCCRSVNPHNT